MPLLNLDEYSVEALMADLPMQRSARSQLQIQAMTLIEGLELRHNPLVVRSDKRHTVQDAETLFIVSQRMYQTPDRWLDIANENSIEYPFTVYPGQVLRIPD